MQVLLPKTKFGLKDLEDKLKNVDIHALFEKEKMKVNMIIQLPKFKQESTLPLNENLKNLGLEIMFTRFKADFTGITKRVELYVSDVIQKAFIEVNEEGTEAAAATAVKVSHTKSIGWYGAPRFKADHPFIYFLRDKDTGILLFHGRVINPLK